MEALAAVGFGARKLGLGLGLGLGLCCCSALWAQSRTGAGNLDCLPPYAGL